jgi:arylformamidase
MGLFDLTRPIYSGMAVHLGDPAVSLVAAARHETDGYAVTQICLGSHTGTHLDAPAHFQAGGKTLDQYALERLVGPALLVDCRPADASDGGPGRDDGGPTGPGAPIDASFLRDRLARYDRLPPGGIVLLRTGGRLLTTEAAQVLLDQDIGMVGTDAPSLDGEPYPVHTMLLGAGVLLLEELAGLDRVEPGPLMCACLPLAVVGTDGAPARVVAWR